MSDKVLYYGQPINWAHPLNRGLVSEWSVVPWYASGPRFINLAGRNHGTLTGGPTWQGARGRPGGYGSILTGSSSAVESASYPFVSTTHATISGWVYRATGGTYQAFGTGVNTNSRFNILWFSDDNIYYTNGSAFAMGASSLTGWRHLAYTFNGSIPLASVYMDGRLFASSALSGGATVVSSGLFWAGYDSGNAAYTPGNYDSLLVHDGRALSASEVYALYEDSRRGNPQRRNWISTRTYFGVSGGGSDTGSGAVSLQFDASAVSASDVIGSGAVSLSMTVAGGGKADATTIGAAAVSFSAQGVSQAEAISNGSALFSFDATAIPFGGDVTDGAAEFSIIAAAVGASDATGSGSALIGFSAAAEGKADAAGAGLVSLSFTALGAMMVDAITRGASAFSFDVLSSEAIALIPDRDFTVAFWSGIDSTVDFHNTDYDVIVDFKG